MVARSVALALAAVLVACMPTFLYVPPGQYLLPEPIILPAPADSVWPLLIDVVNEWGLPIKLVDRSSGLLQSERAAGSPGAAQYFDCGKTLIIDPTTDDTTEVDGGTASVTITFSLLARGQQSALRISTNVGGGCVSRGTLEQGLFAAVRERIAERLQ